jgi:hypothetical protein
VQAVGRLELIRNAVADRYRVGMRRATCLLSWKSVRGGSNIHPQRRTMLWINLLGGSAVLASYVHGLLTHPATRASLWGQVPQAILPFYEISMFLAVGGYCAFTYFLLFRLDPDQARVANRFGFSLLNLFYALILVPSAAWMPLTLAMIEHPTSSLWFAIRLILALVGIGSVGLFVALLTLRPRKPACVYWLAVIGSLAFCIQTALLDALVWPTFFPV